MLFSVPVQIFSRRILMTVHEALLTLELIAFLPSSYSNCCERGIILCASHLSLTQALRTPRREFWGREWKIQRPQDRSLLSMYQTTSKPLTSKRNRVKMSHVSECSRPGVSPSLLDNRTLRLAYWSGALEYNHNFFLSVKTSSHNLKIDEITFSELKRRNR